MKYGVGVRGDEILLGNYIRALAGVDYVNMSKSHRILSILKVITTK